MGVTNAPVSPDVACLPSSARPNKCIAGVAGLRTWTCFFCIRLYFLCAVQNEAGSRQCEVVAGLYSVYGRRKRFGCRLQRRQQPSVDSCRFHVGGHDDFHMRASSVAEIPVFPAQAKSTGKRFGLYRSQTKPDIKLNQTANGRGYIHPAHFHIHGIVASLSETISRKAVTKTILP